MSYSKEKVLKGGMAALDLKPCDGNHARTGKTQARAVIAQSLKLIKGLLLLILFLF